MIKKIFVINMVILIVCFRFQNMFAQFSFPQTFGPNYKGQTITLTEDIQATYMVEKGITIMADNFTLDGADHTITGVDSAKGGDHTGVNPRDKYIGITIKNLIVTKWGDGIYGRQWMYGLMDNCYLLDNATNGFAFASNPNTGTEIRNSTFEGNARYGIKLSRTDSCYVHDNDFIENERGGISIEQLSTLYNIIEGNTIQDNKRFGMALNNARHNLIKDNEFFNNKLVVDEADSNTFIGNIIEDTDTSLVVQNCTGNIFIDCKIINSNKLDVLLNNGALVTFIGTEFNKDLVVVNDGASELTVKWHLNVTIKNGGTIEGAIVKIFDKDQNLVAEDTTNFEGKIETLDLVEYVQDSTGRAYTAPYHLEISKEGYPLLSRTVDFTENKDIQISFSSVEDFRQGNLLQEFTLFQNYPNPFNPITAISYQLPKSCKVILKIFDINGKMVRTLVKGVQSAGHKIVEWDAKNYQGKEVASGIYLYSLVAGDFSQTHRMILIR